MKLQLPSLGGVAGGGPGGGGGVNPRLAPPCDTAET